MKSLIYKHTIVLACIISFGTAHLLSGCGDRISSEFTVELPQVPDSWVSLLGEPHWRLEWLDKNGTKQTVVIQPSQSTKIEIPVTWINPVTALPYWSEFNLIPGLFKPAGALFPFDFSGKRKQQNSVQLCWKAGVDTVYYWELAYANNKNTVKIPANFDWHRFRELFETDVLSEAVCKDPWLINWRLVAEKTISSNFDRRRLVPQPVENVEIPVPAGLWYGTSPFTEPLFFKAGENPVFPVHAGINVWISSEGILRVSGKTWIFTPFPSGDKQ
jgi:hypothetical protein